MMTMETNTETHLALRHNAWCPIVAESSGNSPLPDTNEREVALEALRLALQVSGSSTICRRSMTRERIRIGWTRGEAGLW